MSKVLRVCIENGAAFIVSLLVMFISRTTDVNNFYDLNSYLNPDLILLTGSTSIGILVYRLFKRDWHIVATVGNILYVVYCALIYGLTVNNGTNYVGLIYILVGAILFVIIFFAESYFALKNNKNETISKKEKNAYTYEYIGYKYRIDID